MNPSTTNQGNEDALTRALCQEMRENPSGVFRLDGTSSNAVSSRFSDVAQFLNSAEVSAFLVTDDRDDFQSLVQDATAYANATGLLDDVMLEMADRASRESDARFRFWQEFVSRVRHVLVIAVSNPKPWIAELASRCYTDPIAEIDPEFSSGHVLGSMFVVGGEIEATPIDCRVATREVVRNALDDSALIDRLVEKTGGDVDSVEHIVTALHARETNLSLVRYQTRSPEGQVPLNVLAIANRAVALQILELACAHFVTPDQFRIVFRALLDDGLLKRIVNNGRVQIQTTDSEMARLIRVELSDEETVRLHVALAESELAETGIATDSVIVAHHLAGAHDPRAIEATQQSVPILIARGDLDAALDALSFIVEQTEDREVANAATIDSIELLERAGNFDLAIARCEEIVAHKPDIQHVLARLLFRVGRLGEAESALENVTTDDPQLLTDVELTRADIFHGLGRHDEVMERMSELIETLDIESPTPHQTRAKIRATNALARIDFFRHDFDSAIARWEENRVVASTHGWDQEVARSEANLGVVAMAMNNNADAQRRLLRALELTDIQHVLPRAHCLVNLAILSQRERDFTAALKYGLDAMRVANHSGDIAGFSIAARNLMALYVLLGAFDRAERMMTYLRGRSDWTESTLNGSWNVLTQAEFAFERGEYKFAVAQFDTLIQGDLSKIFKPRAELRAAYAALRAGDKKRAVKVIKGFKSVQPDIDALALLLEAELETGKSKISKAQAALEACEKHGKVDDAIRARILLSRHLHDSGAHEEAVLSLRKELQNARELTREMPENMKTTFYSKPGYQQIISMLREFEGDVPAEFIAPSTVESTQVDRARFSRFIGEHPDLHRIFRVVDKVAKSDATVLIYGESGTGKELVAEALHRNSDRQHKPFIKVNCAALVEDLLLSELFGHEKGAFTGAIEQKIGRFELADGGTIFLDEIGDISANTQVALLRVLQEQQFERVGGSATQSIDVRVVCATNRNLEELVARGAFRLDLYYRLKGVVIETPPLRTRRGDIGRLALHFAMHPPTGDSKRISPAAIQELARYSWPGNIRELQNFMRSVALFVDGDTIERHHVDEFSDFFVSGTFDPLLTPVAIDYLDLFESSLEEETEPAIPSTTMVVEGDNLELALVERMIQKGESLSEMKKRLEVECIKRALIQTDGNVTKAAEILQMKRPRLSQIISEHDELTQLKNELVA